MYHTVLSMSHRSFKCSAGVGITPFLSILRSLHQIRTEHSSRVTLIWGIKDQRDFMSLDELALIVRSNAPRINIRITLVLSNKGALQDFAPLLNTVLLDTL